MNLVDAAVPRRQTPPSMLAVLADPGRSVARLRSRAAPSIHGLAIILSFPGRM